MQSRKFSEISPEWVGVGYVCIKQRDRYCKGMRWKEGAKGRAGFACADSGLCNHSGIK